ncbi:hypothetical protein IWX84_001413 [Flavobacterium sp. CG_9.10]|nr:hypothetical protein [Flavobacterium sp. CG_9.10]
MRDFFFGINFTIIFLIFFFYKSLRTVFVTENSVRVELRFLFEKTKF